MAKLPVVAIVVYVGLMGAALAQANAPATGRSSSSGLLRSGHITSTGATVPHPGVAQGDGTTSLDKGIERDDHRIESSICKGC